MSSPSPRKLVAIGIGLMGAVGFIGVILFEHYRNSRRRLAMSRSLGRMESQLADMQAELEQLRLNTDEKEDVKPKSKKNSTAQSVKSAASRSTPVDGYKSPASEIDTSDLEYFDLTDEESFAKKPTLEKILAEVERNLQSDDLATIHEAITLVENLSEEYSDRPEVWYWLGKCYHRLAMFAVTPHTKQQHLDKGVSACRTALELDAANADSHKLYAILVGLRSEYRPARERIADGRSFERHVEIALGLRPRDAMLHHMLGRFKYEIAGLKWIERKMATALFGEPPSGSYRDALACFLEAEKFNAAAWKENRLFVGKCYLALGEVADGVEWLRSARAVASSKDSQAEDRILNKEIEGLLAKHDGYR